MQSDSRKNSPGKPIDLWVVVAMLCLLAIPAIPTLRAVRHTVFVDVSGQHASPLGYTISLSLFVIPILVIGLWLLPQSGKKIPQKAFWTTIAILFPWARPWISSLQRVFSCFRNLRPRLTS